MSDACFSGTVICVGTCRNMCSVGDSWTVRGGLGGRLVVSLGCVGQSGLGMELVVVAVGPHQGRGDQSLMLLPLSILL